ncbi:MFS transporter [Streptacidiphilus sp. PAMC 29251]
MSTETVRPDDGPDGLDGDGPAAASSRRWWALAALAVAMLTIGLDTTVLTVALPTLAGDLHASTADLQWFSGAYTLALAAALLPAGALGDRFGRKRLLLGALLGFGGASVWCAYSGGSGDLIAARTVLGLAAAVMMPLSMAVLPSLFPVEAERSRAFTIWVTSTAVGLPLGPIIGGYLLDHFWWGSIFLINVPLVVIGVVAVAMLVPESRSSRPLPPDLPGVALSSLGLLGLTYGFIKAGQDGWGGTTAQLCITAGIVLLLGFVAWQRRARHPLIDLGLFADRAFSAGTGFATAVSFGLFGLLFAVPQYFQAIEGASPMGTGLRLLPMIGGLLVGTRLVGLIAARAGSGAVVAMGFGLLTAGLAIGATTTVHTGYGVTATWLVLTGAGMGIVLPTSMNAALGTLSADRAGAGSALIGALRQAGGTIGIAILGTILNDGYRNGLGAAAKPPVSDSVSAGVATAHALGDDGLLRTVQTAFVHGMGATLWTCSGICAVSAVLAVFLLPRRLPAGQGSESEPVSTVSI